MVTFTTSRHRSFFATFILTFFATLFFSAATAQKGAGNPAVDLDQIRNGSQTSPNIPAEWVNGNAGASNAHYVESHSIAYRARLSNMPRAVGTEVKLVLGYDIRHSSRNAIDYLTHYNRLLPHDQFPHTTPEPIIPTSGTSFSGDPHDTYLIPKPNATVNPIAAASWQKLFDADEDQLHMSAWGVNITNIQILNQGNLSVAQSEATIEITFLTTTNTGLGLLAWGGHIAARKEWGFDANGVPNSAGGISGSPYHMRTLSWNLSSLGNQDRSLSAAAVIFCESDGGEIAGGGTVCTGTNVAAFTNVTSGTGNGTLSYQWQRSTTSCTEGFTDISGATSETFDPDAAGALAVGTYYYRRITKSDGELDCQDPSNCLTVTINDKPSAPATTYLPPACNETHFKVQVDDPSDNPVIANATYKLYNGAGTLIDTETPTTSDAFTFDTGIPAGAGYKVTVTLNDCVSDPDVCPVPESTRKAVTPTEEITNVRIEGKTKVLAAPNPFTSKVRFSLESAVSGQGSLEIYNIMGQKLATVFQGHVEAGTIVTKEYNVQHARRGNLIYVFRVGDQKVTGKLVNW